MNIEELIKLSEQIIKASNSGVHEIKVVASDVVTTDGIGLLFLSTRDFEEFKKRQDPTKTEKKCLHVNEVQRQGDGFIYTVCKDCGETL